MDEQPTVWGMERISRGEQQLKRLTRRRSARLFILPVICITLVMSAIVYTCFWWLGKYPSFWVAAADKWWIMPTALIVVAFVVHFGRAVASTFWDMLDVESPGPQ